MKKEIKIAYILFLVAVVGYLIKYGLNVFLANHLSPIVYGDYSVAIQLLNIMISLSLFGTNTGARRFLAKYLALNKKSTASDYIAWNIKLIGVTFLIVCSIAVVAITVMILLHALGIRDISKYHLAVYMFWVVPFAALTVLLGSFLLVTNHVFMPLTIERVLRYLVELILFIVVVVFLHRTLDTLSIVGVLLFSFLVTLITTLLIVNKDILSMIKVGFKKMSYTRLLHEEWFFTSSRLIGSGLIFTITSVLDLIIVAIVVTNKEDVGHYAAVLTICGCIWLPARNLYQLVSSKASGLLSSQAGKVKLQSMLDRTNRVVIFLTATLSIAIIYFSSALLAHFGPTYANARYALIIMTLSAFIGGNFRYASLLLIYGGFERLTLMINSVGLALVIVLTVPATYFFGITGAAAAVAFTIVAQRVAAVFFVRKKLGMRSMLWF